MTTMCAVIASHSFFWRISTKAHPCNRFLALQLDGSCFADHFLARQLEAPGFFDRLLAHQLETPGFV